VRLNTSAIEADPLNGLKLEDDPVFAREAGDESIDALISKG